MEGRGKTMRVREGTRVEELLEELGINRETVLVRLNGEICVEEEVLEKGDEVEVIRAVSGG